jgi:hypothetical protein
MSKKCDTCTKLSMDKAIHCIHCGAILTASSQAFRVHRDRWSHCSNCKSDSPKTAKECSACGSRFDDALRECDKCKSLSNIDSKFCTKCGENLIKKIKKTVKYCDSCLTEYKESDHYCAKDGSKLIAREVEVEENSSIPRIKEPKHISESTHNETETSYPTGLPKSSNHNPKVLSKPKSSPSRGNLIQCKQCGTGNSRLELASSGNNCHKCGAQLIDVSTNSPPKTIANGKTINEPASIHLDANQEKRIEPQINADSQKGFLGNLISGNFGLAKTYWVYGVLGAVIVSIFLELADFNAMYIAVLLLYFVYHIIVIIGIWRASAKYEGAKAWRVLARISVVLNWIGIAGGVVSFYTIING